MKSRFLFILLTTTLYSAIASAQIQIGNDIDGEATNNVSGWSVSMPDANTVAIGAANNAGNGAKPDMRVFTSGTELLGHKRDGH